MQPKQSEPVIRVPYDRAYEKRSRSEVADPPPLPSMTEQIAPGCFLTAPKQTDG